MKRFLATVALLATAVAAPASAVTLVAGFNSSTGSVVSQTRSNISLNIAVSGISFSGATPNALTSILLNTPTVRNLTLNGGGLGITGGGSGAQMDTNSNARREAFLVTGSNAFYLTNLTLTSVDQDDTLQIYGVNNDGTLVNFTYGFGNITVDDAQGRIDGAIVGGANGSLLNNVRTGSNGGTNSFGTGLTGTRFTRYLITTRVGGDVQYLGTGGQGFALSALTATVPEPATWGLLLVGFGLVGVAARRRNTAVAA